MLFRDTYRVLTAEAVREYDTLYDMVYPGIRWQ
jgi:hypothetical protein